MGIIHCEANEASLWVCCLVASDMKIIKLEKPCYASQMRRFSRTNAQVLNAFSSIITLHVGQLERGQIHSVFIRSHDQTDALITGIYVPEYFVPNQDFDSLIGSIGSKMTQYGQN